MRSVLLVAILMAGCSKSTIAHPADAAPPVKPVKPAMDAAPAPVDDTAKLVITITKDQSIYLGDREMTLEDLEITLRARVQTEPGLSVVIQADRSVPHARVVAVIERAKAAGVQKFALMLPDDKK
jgi:biopolymer transport protein ExbD